MKLSSLLFVTAFTILSSCHAKHTAVTSTTTIGETVSEPDTAIFIIYQAQDNTYWFGSDGNGVYRYNGKTITHYTTKDGLSNNRIREIQEDKAGNIFFTTLDGISKFDGQNFSTLTVTKTYSPGGSSEWKLQPDDLWFKAEQGKKGPYRYDGKNLYQLEFPKSAMEEAYYKTFPDKTWSPYDVYYIYKDHRGHMWFGTGAFGLYRYDGRTVSNMYEELLTNPQSGGSFGIRSIIEDKEGKFWFCNNQYRYSIQAGDTVINGISQLKYTREKGFDQKAPNGDWSYFLSIVKDDTGTLWMCTYTDGVYSYDGKNLTHYQVKDGDKNITTFSIYKDKAGQLWLGTHAGGAYKFNGKAFEKFRP